MAFANCEPQGGLSAFVPPIGRACFKTAKPRHAACSKVQLPRSHASCSSEDGQGRRMHVICIQPYNAKSHLDLYGDLPTWDLRLHCLMTIHYLASSSSIGRSIRYVVAPASRGHPQCYLKHVSHNARTVIFPFDIPKKASNTCIAILQVSASAINCPKSRLLFAGEFN